MSPLLLLALVTGPAFYRTDDSDQWVSASFRLQPRYARVLLVSSATDAPRTVAVAAPDLNARPPRKARTLSYPVSARFATLQEAVDAARGGELVAVLPGRYAGFVLGDKPGATDGSYIHVKALGRPGQVVIDRPGPDPDWMVLLRAAHHVIIEGFSIAGSTGPGLPPVGPRAGIMLDGDFGRTGSLAHHIALVGNFSHHHAKWGFHSTDTHTVLIQDNLFAFSALEHSGYASDGSDDYVIRRNVFFGSHASGLQCNLDSVSSFREILKHPALRDFPPEEPTRAWAQGLLRRATELWGDHGFPDGRGVNFIIEENVINANGKAGGGSLNLAGLQDSLVQNNLLYGNFNHGVAQWDDANPYDAARVAAPPGSPAERDGPDDLPLFGCRGNRIRNNTVLMANPGRAALQFRNGSWGGRARNNVLVNDAGESIEVFGSSLYRLDSSWNVAGRLGFVEATGPARSLASRIDDEPSSTLGMTRAALAREFVRYGEEPWVVIEGGWWKLNPMRPDFHPRAGSTVLAGRGDRTERPLRDLEGVRRTTDDVGALASKP